MAVQNDQAQKLTLLPSDFAVPCEVQVLNQAAMAFIETHHGDYEVQRMLDRVSAVCSCTKDENGELVQHTECVPCQARIEKSADGVGYCPFCRVDHATNSLK